jgi:hypothetical protein
MVTQRQQPHVAPAWAAGTDPARVWNDLRAGAHNDAERTCLAAAARQADRTWVAAAEGHIDLAAVVELRRDAGWHRLALSAYGILHDSGAYGHLANRHPFACAAAEEVIRAWLCTPTDDDMVLMDDLRFRAGLDVFEPGTGDLLTVLIDAAQTARVFGVPAHRVEVCHAGTRDGVESVRLVVDPPTGPALASPPQPLTGLFDPDATALDAAVTALTRTARIVSGLFREHADAVWDTPPPMPVPDRAATPAARAFPELHLGQSPPPPAEPAEPVTPPGPRRHR